MGAATRRLGGSREIGGLSAESLYAALGIRSAPRAAFHTIKEIRLGQKPEVCILICSAKTKSASTLLVSEETNRGNPAIDRPFRMRHFCRSARETFLCANARATIFRRTNIYLSCFSVTINTTGSFYITAV